MVTAYLLELWQPKKYFQAFSKTFLIKNSVAFEALVLPS